MTFKNRKEFIDSAASEKNTIVFAYPAQRLLGWEEIATNVFRKKTDYFIHSIKLNGIKYDAADLAGNVDATNPWFYDIETSFLYLYTTTDTPNNDKVIATYKLFLSDTPLRLPYDLADGDIVDFEPRVLKTPGFKSTLSSNNIALVSGGTLSLRNTDGYWQTAYQKLVWEGKLVEVYSYSRGMDIETATIIYRGYVEDRSYDDQAFSLSVKDIQNGLEERISLKAYSSADQVDPKFYPTYHRRVYGRNQGLKCRSVSQFSPNIEYTPDEYFRYTTADGLNTFFADNSYYVNNQVLYLEQAEYFLINNIKYFLSLTGTSKITLKNADGVEAPEGTFTYNLLNFGVGPYVVDKCYEKDSVKVVWKKDVSQTVSIIEPIDEVTPGYTLLGSKYNRTWAVAGHDLSQAEATITSQVQLNKFYISNPTNFRVGDRIEVDGQELFIGDIQGNLVKTTSSLNGLKVGFTVLRKPVIDAWIRDTKIPYQMVSQSYDAINNLFKVNISKLTELVLPIAKSTGKALTVHKLTKDNGNSNAPIVLDCPRQYTTPFPVHPNPSNADSINVGDVIGLRGMGQTAFLIVSSKTEFSIPNPPNSNIVYDKIVLSFIDREEQQSLLALWPDTFGTISNDTITYPTTTLEIMKIEDFQTISSDEELIVDCYGITEDRTPTGKLIETAADIIRDLFKDNIKIKDFIEDDVFDNSAIVTPYPLNIAIPQDIDSKVLPKVKDIVNTINTSVKTSFYITNNFRIGIKSVLPEKKEIARIIYDDDVISWSIKGKSGSLFSSITTQWDKRDYDIASKGANNQILILESDFVKEFDISGKNVDYSILSAVEEDVQELSERLLFGHTLTENIVKIKGAYTLSDLEVGEQVILDFRKLFNNPYGINRFTGMITSITRDGDSIELEVSDLGNLYNRVATISPDDAVEYSLASLEEKSINTYIADDDGLVNGDPLSDGKNIIG